MSLNRQGSGPSEQRRYPIYPAGTTVPEGFELRRKRARYARPAVIILLVLIAGIALLIAGCVAVVGTVTRQVNDAANELDRHLGATHTLTYEVEGDTADPHITFVTPAGNSQVNGVALPWATETTVSGYDLASLTVTTGAVEDTSTVTCRITYQGQTVAENTAAGPLGTASCSIFANELSESPANP